MAKKTSSLLSLVANREFTVALEPDKGSITLFYAFINEIKVVQGDGTKKRTWSGTLPDSQIRLKVRVVGIGEASFKLSIDLPGTADDQSLTLKLKKGYYEIEILL